MLSILKSISLSSFLIPSFKLPKPSLPSFQTSLAGLRNHDVRISLFAGLMLVCSLLMMKAQANSAYYGALSNEAMYDQAQGILHHATSVTQEKAQLYDALQTGSPEALSDLGKEYAAPVLQLTNPVLANALGFSKMEALDETGELQALEPTADPSEDPMEDLGLNLDLSKQAALLEDTASFKTNFMSLAHPVAHPSISSSFGVRHGRAHTGTDFQAPVGTPIYAAASGRVINAGATGAYGNLIIVEHGNGITTHYGHCSRLRVRVGQIVKRGQLIGNVGNTGRSTGPHLHFELMANGAYINPVRYLPSPGHRTLVMRKGFRKVSEL